MNAGLSDVATHGPAMEFLNFELRINEGAGGTYTVTVVRSPAGEATATMRLAPDEPEHKRRLQAVKIARSGGGRGHAEGERVRTAN